MKRYLGMSEQEISENEMSWAEERGDAELAQVDAPTPRNVGISAGNIQSDLEGLGAEAPPAGGPDLGGAPGPAGPVGVGSPTAGAQPAL